MRRSRSFTLSFNRSQSEVSVGDGAGWCRKRTSLAKTGRSPVAGLVLADRWLILRARRWCSAMTTLAGRRRSRSDDNIVDVVPDPADRFAKPAWRRSISAFTAADNIRGRPSRRGLVRHHGATMVDLMTASRADRFGDFLLSRPRAELHAPSARLRLLLLLGDQRRAGSRFRACSRQRPSADPPCAGQLVDVFPANDVHIPESNMPDEPAQADAHALIATNKASCWKVSHRKQSFVPAGRSGPAAYNESLIITSCS